MIGLNISMFTWMHQVHLKIPWFIIMFPPFKCGKLGVFTSFSDAPKHQVVGFFCSASLVFSMKSYEKYWKIMLDAKIHWWSLHRLKKHTEPPTIRGSLCGSSSRCSGKNWDDDLDGNLLFVPSSNGVIFVFRCERWEVSEVMVPPVIIHFNGVVPYEPSIFGVHRERSNCSHAPTYHNSWKTHRAEGGLSHTFLVQDNFFSH